MDLSGDGIAELDLRVLDGVPAEERDASLAENTDPAGEDAAEHGRIGVSRIRRNRQGREGPAAHCVDVAQRVGRGDPSVHERVVHDWSEEIDCLHEGPLVIQLVHTRIVRGPIVDQDPVVSMYGQIAQDPGELTSRELARSTGAVRVRRQASQLSVSLLD